MYIKKIEITNIRTIKNLDIEFSEPAGWHVLLGDNGAGKSSLIRAISAALLGPSEVLRLDPNFSNWVKNGERSATINLVLERDVALDKRSGQGEARGGVKDITEIRCQTNIEQDDGNGRTWKFKDALTKKDGAHPDYYNWGSGDGWFSAAFGPYRRFTGGDQSMEAFYARNPKIGAHLTAFKENAALTESVIWLKDLQFRSLAKPTSEGTTILKGIVHFTNQEDLLPAGYSIKEITPDGPIFNIPDGSTVHLYELSEGIKSVTSLAFELMRLLLRDWQKMKDYVAIKNASDFAELIHALPLDKSAIVVTSNPFADEQIRLLRLMKEDLKDDLFPCVWQELKLQKSFLPDLENLFMQAPEAEGW